VPSHSERVRRNYHDVKLHTADSFRTNELCIVMRFTKREIASWMHASEAGRYVVEKIGRQVMEALKR
jgi:hypothetical protein